MRPTVEAIDSLDVVADDWRALASRAGNPLLSWEGASTWWGHSGRGRPRRAAVCRVGGRPLASLPLYEASGRPLRMLRMVGLAAGDQLGLVCASADRAAASAALVGWLGRVDWPLLLAERLPHSAHLRKRIRYAERRLQREYGVRFRLADDPDRLDDDVTTLARSHDPRWGAAGTGALSGARGTLHRELAPVARAASRAAARLAGQA